MGPKILYLIQGELLRLNKYRVTLISFLVALIWGLALYFIDDMDILSRLLPLIIQMEVTMMSIIFIGSILFFEKSEQTISTLLVTPISTGEQIWSKVIANTIHLLFSSVLILLVFYFIKEVEVHFIWMLIGLILSLVFHSLLGYVFSYHSKDFTSMLLGVMMFIILLSIPSLLHQFDLAFKGEVWRYILLITPAQASIELITFGFTGKFVLATLVSYMVLISLTVALYFGYVKRAYKTYAIKQGGI